MDMRTASQRPAGEAPAPRPETGHHIPFMKPTLASKTLVVLLIVLSLMVIGVMGVKIFGAANADSGIKSKQYQALFLTNGQVYFGHLSSINSDYVKLTNIYYLQVQQTVQPSSGSNSQQQPQVSLTKLGSELHGPEDSMYVSKQQVLFWENLKNDGKVVSAITAYQKGQH